MGYTELPPSFQLTPPQVPAIPAFSIPISILRLVLRLVDSDTDTDTRKSETFDSDSILIPKSNKFYNIDFDEMPKIIEWGTRF